MTFKNILFYIYKHEKLFAFIISILLIALLIIIDTTLVPLGPPSYNIIDISRKLLEAEKLRSLPQYIGILLFFGLPIVLSFILHRLMVSKIITIDEERVLSALRNRCGELVELGNKWIAIRINEVVNKLSAFANGTPVNASEVKQICKALYETTRAKKVEATCLYKIYDIYSNPEQKDYMTATAEFIGSLQKFTFYRYLIIKDPFEKIFTDSPTDAAKWIVRIHAQNKMRLFAVQFEAFLEIIRNNGLDPRFLDVLYFDGSLLLALQANNA